MERNRRQDRRPGKESASAKHVICNCPELRANDAEKCRRIDAAYTINKLRELVSDPVSSDHVPRISQLLCDYLREIGDEGYVSFGLPILEIASDKNPSSCKSLRFFDSIKRKKY